MWGRSGKRSGKRSGSAGAVREDFPRIQRCWIALTGQRGTAGGERREGTAGEVSARDSGRVSAQGRVIGGQKSRFPTIAASATSIASSAPSIEAFLFREPGEDHPPLGRDQKYLGSPMAPAKGPAGNFRFLFFHTRLPMSSVYLVTLFPGVLCKYWLPQLLIDVTCWWLFVVVEFPREARPPAGAEPMPEVHAVPLLGCSVFRDVTLEVHLPQTRVVTLRTTAFGRGIIYAQSRR